LRPTCEHCNKSLPPASLEARNGDNSAFVPVTWVCAYAKAPEKMTVTSADNTSITARYLPLRCR
jgi:hypothetical protein